MVSTAPETRKRLLQQGRLAFAEKGHDRVSLQRDVLGPAGVSTGSFYHQFSDKTELLVAILEEAAERGRDAVQDAVPDSADMSPKERLRLRLRLWLGLIEGAEDLFRIQLHERSNPDARVRELVAGLRQRSFGSLAERLGANEKLASPDFDQDLAARLTMALLGGVITDYLDLSEQQRLDDRDRLADGLADYIIAGLTNMANITPPETKPETGAS